MFDGQKTEPVVNGLERRKIRTVVADDSPEFLKALGAFLEALPELEIVGWGTHGGEAMALSEWLQPELVVLDMEMPVVTGLQAAEVLRTRQPWLRIIVVSVNDSVTWREECRRVGVDVFVTKHRLADELPEQINRLFAQSGRSGGFKI